MSKLRIGTCSWKYESWKGLVYPEFGDFNYLEEYSKKYNTVEVDQWFWSLHPNNKITLPKQTIVNDYNNSTPDDFKFTIKVPNSITLTHPYSSKLSNEHFLSDDLMSAFIHSIEPIKSKVGMLMFQFEYLNKQKMNSQFEFQQRLTDFFVNLDREYNYAIEIRNPNYINEPFVSMLKGHDISFVFLQGYYMPQISDVFKKIKNQLNQGVVIRLHGKDRKGIEIKTNKIWNNVVDPKDDQLVTLVELLRLLNQNGVDVYLNVNNHYEGSAPLTISKLESLINI